MLSSALQWETPTHRQRNRTGHGDDDEHKASKNVLFGTNPYAQLKSQQQYPELPNLKVPVSLPVGRTSQNGQARDGRSRSSSRQSGHGYHRSSRRKQHQQRQQYEFSQQQSGQPDKTTTLPYIAGSSQKLNNSIKETNTTHNNLLITGEEHSMSGCSSIKGLKPGNPNWNNQDNFFISESFDTETKIFCVLDGHGENGHHVSRRCREQFPSIIRSSNMDIPRAFLAMQSDLNVCEYDVKCSGATCVMAIMEGSKLSVYNCGDSRAVLGRRNPKGMICAHALSLDHKPDRADERKRVLNCGGHLGCRQVLVNQPGRGPVSMPVGPCRVWYQHRGETLGLAMSRSLGDSVVHKSGVSAEPEILEHMIDQSDEFIMLATDGVWDVVDNNYAVQMVSNFVTNSPTWSPIEAAQCVAKYARSRWEKMSPMVDDITCIVIKLK